jgi:threonine aldolase
VGVLAAAGLVALDTMIERLAEDHANAGALARGLAEFAAVELDPDLIQTNIVRFGIPSGRGVEIAAELRREGVLINSGASELRMVTHYGITASDITATVEAMRAALAAVGLEPFAVPAAG